MRFLCCAGAVFLLTIGLSARVEAAHVGQRVAYSSGSGGGAPVLQMGRVDWTISEPGKVALLGTGLLGFAGLIRRRFAA